MQNRDQGPPAERRLGVSGLIAVATAAGRVSSGGHGAGTTSTLAVPSLPATLGG
jgi:hypothetical protein